MKSMTKLMVVAMILAAALVVAPVAARDIANSGSTVYIGEKSVNLTATLDVDGSFATTGGPGTLVYYSSVTGPGSATIGKTLPVTKAESLKFEVDATNFDGRLGAWYVFNESNGGPLTDPTKANGFFLVDKPSTSLDVKLWDKTKNEMTTSSVKDKSVSRSDQIAFEIKHNIRLPDDVVENPDNGFEMQIEVRTPDGGLVTSLGPDSPSFKLPLNRTTAVNTTAITLDGLKPGIYTVQAKWNNTAAFEPEKPAPVTFEVRSKTLTLTSSKDSVVRGNHFVVTIQGESKTKYNLFVKSPDATPAKNPMIVPNQPDVEPYVRPGGTPGTNATVKTDAGGKIDVEFNTTTSTEDKQFTIRVENTDPDKAKTDYDEVKVKVEKGSVTITASGTGTYYIGEEVTLSGTCTDNDTTVHLFMTGPNLASANGVNLLTLNPVSNTGAAGTSPFNTADVKADGTWSFKWNTGDTVQNKALDAGGYTIYAVSQPVDKSGLSNAEYATASIQLRSGFITATSSGAVIAKGDDLKLTGAAQGDPDSVWVWIFGKNYQRLADPATVEDDGSFEYELKGSQTKDLAAGQYFVVIQHPMMNKEFDIRSNVAGWINGTADSGFNSVRIAGLQASDAATALINALDSPNIDDTYVKLTFVVEEPNIWIDAIGDKAAGSKFTITGTTNLAVGDTLNIEVTSAAFQPTSKSEASGFGSVAGTTKVEQGDGANTWSFEVDGASFKPDQYIVKVECIETDTTATATFNVVEAVPTTQATPTATVTGGETTPTGTTTTEPTPTQSPGFGALVALAGLGAVAFLVLRRD